jgi:hypothetical protein
MTRRGGSQLPRNAIMSECFLCQQQKQSGPQRYEGRNIPQWNVWVCNGCKSNNWDGIVIASSHGERIIRHLRSNHIPFTLNDKGHLPIPG